MPDDNFYHQVERSLDLSFVRELEAISLEVFTQDEHRRSYGGSGAKPGKID